MTRIPHFAINQLDLDGNVLTTSAFHLIAMEVQALAAKEAPGQSPVLAWEGLVRDLGGSPNLRGEREAQIHATVAVVNRIIDAWNRGKSRPHTLAELRHRIDTPPQSSRFQRLLSRLRLKHRHS